eukprot:54679-Eustigmatos_ZCMA.PRE.1
MHIEIAVLDSPKIMQRRPQVACLVYTLTLHSHAVWWSFQLWGGRILSMLLRVHSGRTVSVSFHHEHGEEFDDGDEGP